MMYFVITVLVCLGILIPIGVMGFFVYRGQRTALLVLKIQLLVVVLLFGWGLYLVIRGS